MNQQTTTKPPHHPDANETLSDLVYHNRRLIRGDIRPATERTTEPVITRRRFRMSRSLQGILIALLLVLALWITIQQAAIPLYGWLQDQWYYGDSRVTQMDADVGHGGQSHFIAEYYRDTIVVVEIPLDHPNAYHVYTLTGFIGATGTPVVLLSVQDINHDGKPDLVVQIEGADFRAVLFNTGSAFITNGG